MGVYTGFVYDEKQGYGYEWLKWFGNEVLNMSYNKDDDCYCGEINGNKVLIVFDCVSIFEEVLEDERCKRYTVLNKVNEKYSKYVGYILVLITCCTDSDHDYYKWGPCCYGKITEDLSLDYNSVRELKLDWKIVDILYGTDIKYGDSNKKLSAIDADDCANGFKLYKDNKLF